MKVVQPSDQNLSLLQQRQAAANLKFLAGLRLRNDLLGSVLTPSLPEDVKKDKAMARRLQDINWREDAKSFEQSWHDLSAEEASLPRVASAFLPSPNVIRLFDDDGFYSPALVIQAEFSDLAPKGVSSLQWLSSTKDGIRSPSLSESSLANPNKVVKGATPLQRLSLTKNGRASLSSLKSSPANEAGEIKPTMRSGWTGWRIGAMVACVVVGLVAIGLIATGVLAILGFGLGKLAVSGVSAVARTTVGGVAVIGSVVVGKTVRSSAATAERRFSVGVFGGGARGKNSELRSLVAGSSCTA